MMPLRRLTAAAMLLIFVFSVTARAEDAGTTIIYDVPWAPGDAPRAGAAEFAILLNVAQLRQNYARAGIVAVGNRHGQLQPATEEALNRAALMGVAVVRLAGAVKPPVLADDFFIEVGAQSAPAVERLLADCLNRFGAPPAAVDPAHPTRRECNAIRAVVSRYQMAFDTAGALTKAVALTMGPRNDYEN